MLVTRRSWLHDHFWSYFVRRDARQHNEGNTCIIDNCTIVIFRHEQQKQKHGGHVRINWDMPNKCQYGRETEGGISRSCSQNYCQATNSRNECLQSKKKNKKKTLLTFKLAQQRYNFEQNRPCVIVKLKPKIRWNLSIIYPISPETGESKLGRVTKCGQIWAASTSLHHTRWGRCEETLVLPVEKSLVP